MRKWKSIVSIALCTAMVINTGIVVETPMDMSMGVEAMENDEITDKIPVTTYNSTVENDSPDVVDSGEGIDFENKEGKAVFDAQTKAALEDFTDELLDMYEAYPADEITKDEAKTYVEANSELEVNQEADDFQTKRLIVKVTADVDSYGAVAVADGYRGIAVLQYDTEEAAREAYEQLQNNEVVEFVETDDIVTVAEEVIATDTSVWPELEGGVEGTYLTSYMDAKTSFTSWGGTNIEAAEFNQFLIEETEELPIVVVGVLDTGIDYSHPIFENRVIRNDKNYSGDGDSKDDVYSYHPHGTATAGIIADITMENVWVKPYKVLGKDGSGYESGICAGWMEALEDGVDVINMSLGGKGRCYLEEEMAELSVEMDVPVVVAAGNDYADTVDVAPANIKSCITVSATQEDGKVDAYSNTGKEVDIAAPGSDINVPQNKGEYKVGSGTSYAAPHVAASVAMLLSYDAEMSREEIICNLINHATDMGEEGFDNEYGYGLLNMNFKEMLSAVEAPELLLESGVYDKTVEVEITCADNNEVYYVLDGEGKAPVKYTQPIILDKSHSVEAYCVKNGIYSERIAAVYYIGDTVLEEACDISSTGILYKYETKQKRVAIPEVIKGVTVTAVEADIDNVQEIVLPKTVKDLFNYTYSRIADLKSIEVVEDNPYLTAVDGVLYSKDMTRLISCPPYKNGKFDMPDTVKIIDDAAFYLSQLTEVTVSACLVQINDGAFWNCKFEKLHLPATVKMIASGALQKNSKYGIREITVDEANPCFVVEDGVLYSADKTRLLHYNRDKSDTEYHIDENTKEIDCFAFVQNLSLKKLIVPESVELIEWIMIDKSCRSLTDIYFMGNMPYRIEVLSRFGITTRGSQPFGNVDKVSIHYLKGAYGFGEIVGNGEVFGDYDLNYKCIEEEQEYDNPVVTESAVIYEYESKYSSSVGGYVYNSTGKSKEIELLFNKKTGTVEGAVDKDQWYNYCKLVIPASMEGVTVTRIGRNAFEENKKLYTIELPDTIERIESDAFNGCNRMTIRELPKNLTYIGSYAFRGCNNLTSSQKDERSSYIFPDKLTYIGNRAFADINSFYQIVFPESIEFIGEYAFFDDDRYYTCVGCFKGNLPDMGEYALGYDWQTILCSYNDAGGSKDYMDNNYSMERYEKSIDFDTVWTIGYTDESNGVEYAYHVFSQSLAVSGGSISTVTELTVPAKVSGYSVAAIERGFLNQAYKAKKIVVPATVKRLEYYSMDIAMDNSIIEFLGAAPALANEYAFGSVSDKDRFEIWYHQDEMGYQGNYWKYWKVYPYLEKRFIVWEDEAQEVTWQIDTLNNNELIMLEGSPKNLIVPDSYDGYTITNIDTKAFYECDTLQVVTLPGTTVEIGDKAFYGCDSLTKIELSEKLSVIGEYAFGYCTKLEKIDFPESIKEIHKYAFRNCDSLTDITVPECVDMGNSIFYNCSGMKSITFEEGMTSMPSYTFYGCTALETVKLPTTLLSIESYAFGYCRALTEIELPEKLEKIGYDAFYYCSGLLNVELPDSVRQIAAYAFENCTSMKTIKLSSSLTSISNRTFGNCRSMTRVVIPPSVTSIAARAFGYLDYSGTKMETFTLAGYGEETVAQKYAEEHGFTYENLGEYIGAGDIVSDTAVKVVSLTAVNTEIELSPKEHFYNGKAHTPKVTVVCSGEVLNVKEDYSLFFINNINIGQAYVIVRGKGNYKGTLLGTFAIVENPDTWINVEGVVIWDDNNNQDGKRPDRVVINLLADNQIVSNQAVSVDENGEWNYTFSKVRKFANDGKTVVNYTVKGESISGYTSAINGTTITNVHTPEVTEVTGSIIWSDDSDRDGIRPDMVGVKLLKNGAAIKSVMVTPDAVGTWNYSFGELDKYEAGKAIEYTVTQNAVTGYEVCEDNGILTNKHTPAVTTVSGIIEWKDNDNQAGARPEAVIVEVYANGKKVKSQTITSTDSDVWEYNIVGLWKNEEGVPIVYTVKQLAVSGYKTMVDGIAITNVVIPTAVPPATPTVTPTVTPTETSKPMYKRGDVDGNGKVTLVDAQLTLKAALNIMKLNEVQKAAADVNGDGKVVLIDAQMILKAALNIMKL